MSDKRDKLPTRSSRSEIESFLRKAAAAPPVKRGEEPGRLVFAMDATASREPTWNQACEIQGQMFLETESLGGLEIQLCHYGGFRQFEASPWLADSRSLLARMTAVRCAAGKTQITRVLRHVQAETRRRKVQALVFVGDCMEEDIDELAHEAGSLGLLGVPAFMFHEGHDPVSARAFKQIARLSGGAFCPFDANSARQLRELLTAVAVYAAGGRRALEDFGRRRGGAVPLLTRQIKGR